MVTTGLACLAAAVWLVLTYGVPASLLLSRQRYSVLGGVGGSWLLWVVGTQSLSIDASTLISAWPSHRVLLATVAVSLWSVGLVLYLLLAALILLRWLTVVMTPATLSPDYWILMGATGTTVLAGSGILTLPGTLPAVSTITGFVRGTCFVFWSFGTWWIPLLVVLGLWRHVLGQWPLKYEPCGAWSSRSACTAWPRCRSARPPASASWGPSAGRRCGRPLPPGCWWRPNRSCGPACPTAVRRASSVTGA
jgi:tellurite resistance protein TehA-like permease